MSKEEDVLRERLKGAEPQSTPYPEPVPMPKNEADKTYQMPGEADVEVQPEVDMNVHKRTYKNDDKNAQADYFKRLNGESKTDEPVKANEPVSEVVTESIVEKPPLPPTPIYKGDTDDLALAMENKLDAMFKQISSIKKSNEEKDETIELLLQSNADLFLIDMQTLSEDLNDFKNTLLSIGTEDQDDEVERVLKNRGPDMAFKKSEAFRLDDKTMARKGLPIVTSIEGLMNRFQEKLKFTVEA